MKARCGLEDCDCEYTIGALLAALKELATAAGGIPRIFFHDEGLEQRVVGAHRKARAAIAKAEEGS